MQRAILAVAAMGIAMAGCLDGSTSSPAEATLAGPATEDDAPSEPYEVARQEFFAATTGGAGSIPVSLEHDVSDLVLTIDFGSSAYWDFWFAGIPGCVGKGPGVGAHPNSAQWTQGCGAVEAGAYDLSWDFIGAAQGVVTVTAVP